MYYRLFIAYSEPSIIVALLGTMKTGSFNFGGLEINLLIIQTLYIGADKKWTYYQGLILNGLHTLI